MVFSLSVHGFHFLQFFSDNSVNGFNLVVPFLDFCLSFESELILFLSKLIFLLIMLNQLLHLIVVLCEFMDGGFQ